MTKHEGGRYHDGERFLPWYTGPCLEWLQTLDLNGKYVFEFGVGDSTLWYLSNGAIVAGVESSLEWINKLEVPYVVFADSIEEYFRYFEYLHSMSMLSQKQPYFDLVIIDGDYRDECTEHALKALKPGGYLIIDNFEQETVCPDWPLTKKLIEGMPIKLYYEPDHWDKWCTAVIQKSL